MTTAPLRPASRCRSRVVAFPSAPDADRCGFLLSPSHPESKGWEKSSPQQRGGETGEAKPRPPPRSSRSPSPSAPPARAHRVAHPPRQGARGGRGRARRKRRGRQVLGDLGEAEWREKLREGSRAAESVSGYHASPPQRASWILEPTTLPPTRSQPPPARGSIRLPSDAHGGSLGSWGRTGEPKLTGERAEAGVGSGQERVAVRSSAGRRSSASHPAFWKVPAGAPQPSFVAEPGRVTAGSPAPPAAATARRLPGQPRGGARAAGACAEAPCGGGPAPGPLALLELSGASSTESAGEGGRLRRERG